jgi:hypothetical protein
MSTEVPTPQRFWGPETSRPAPLLLAAAVAVVGALVLRPGASGLAALVLGALVLGVAFRAGSPRVGDLSWAALACALLAVGLLRSADWLVGLCFVAAVATGALSLVRGRTWTGVLLSGAAAGLVPLRVLAWTRRTIAGAPRPDLPLRRIAAVGGLTAGLLAVFLLLFSTADPAYAQLLDDLVPSHALEGVGPRVVVLGLVFVAVLTAAYLAHRPPLVDDLAPGPGKPVGRWEWLVPLALLDLLFLSFVAVQLTVLFGGREHVLSTTGLTYAQYARHGFWQLLIVTGLTLVVLAVAARTAPLATRAQRAVVRFLLGALCVLSLVIVASAVHRMSLYEREYGFTRLRLLVEAVELMLGAAFVLLMLAGIRMRGNWLPRVSAALASLCLLALAGLNPDAYIASHNVARYEQDHRIDVAYLSGLSADAVTALDRLPAALRNCVLTRIAGDLAGTEDPWYDTNLARNRARRLLAAKPPGACVTP